MPVIALERTIKRGLEGAMGKKFLFGMLAVVMIAVLASNGQADLLFADQVINFNNISAGDVNDALGVPDGVL